MSIATSLAALQQAKANIAAAITQKGGTVNAGDGFADFAADIATITGGGASIVVPTPGDVPVVENAQLVGTNQTSLTSTGVSITISVSGTYRLKWSALRSRNSTASTRLYKNGTPIGSEVTTWQNTYTQSNTLDIACAANDVITVYAKGSGNTTVFAGNLSACVAQALNSTGTPVQTYSSTLTLSSTGTNSATGFINCGFRPDVIVLYGWKDENHLDTCMGICFGANGAAFSTAGFFTEGVYYILAEQTATGCEYEIGAQDWNWAFRSVNGLSFSVMAVKYI